MFNLTYYIRKRSLIKYEMNKMHKIRYKLQFISKGDEKNKKKNKENFVIIIANSTAQFATSIL